MALCFQVLDCVSKISILIIVVLEISDLQELLRTTCIIIEHSVVSFNCLLIVFFWNARTFPWSKRNVHWEQLCLELETKSIINAIKFDKLICWNKKIALMFTLALVLGSHFCFFDCLFYDDVPKLNIAFIERVFETLRNKRFAYWLQILSLVDFPRAEKFRVDKMCVSKLLVLTIARLYELHWEESLQWQFIWPQGRAVLPCSYGSPNNPAKYTVHTLAQRF